MSRKDFVALTAAIGCLSIGVWGVAQRQTSPPVAPVNAELRFETTSGTPETRLLAGGVPADEARELAASWGWLGVKVNEQHGPQGVRCLDLFGEEAVPLLSQSDAPRLLRVMNLSADFREVLATAWRGELLRWASDDRLDRVLDRASRFSETDWALVERFPTALPVLLATDDESVRDLIRREGRPLIDLLTTAQLAAGSRGATAVAQEWQYIGNELMAVEDAFGPFAVLAVLPPSGSIALGYRETLRHAIRRLGVNTGTQLMVSNRSDIIRMLEERTPMEELTRAVDRLVSLSETERSSFATYSSAVRLATITEEGRLVGIDAMRRIGGWVDWIQDQYPTGELRNRLFGLASQSSDAIAVVITFHDHPAMQQLLARPEVRDIHRVQMALHEVAFGGESRLRFLATTHYLNEEIEPKVKEGWAWEYCPGIATYRWVRDYTRGKDVTYGGLIWSLGSDGLSLIGSVPLVGAAGRMASSGASVLASQTARVIPAVGRMGMPVVRSGVRWGEQLASSSVGRNVGRANEWIVKNGGLLLGTQLAWDHAPIAVDHVRELLAVQRVFADLSPIVIGPIHNYAVEVLYP